MSALHSYLKMETAEALATLESLIASGYDMYDITVRAQYDIASTNGTVSDEQFNKWDLYYVDWQNVTAGKLREVFHSVNYTNEFIVANRSTELKVSASREDNLIECMLGSITKLEEFRNRIFDKGVLHIAKSGTIEFYSVKAASKQS